MKKLFVFVLCAVLFIPSIYTEASAGDKKQKHLFILSGQSNMAGMDPNVSFTPAVTKKFGKENVIVAKSAYGGQPIRCWYKNYQFPENYEASDKAKRSIGRLYKKLIESIKAATEGKSYDTVTFVWMQGESDATQELGDVYAESFKGILKQLKEDLKKDKINFVIGRLSDWSQAPKKAKHWEMIREIQVKLAEEAENGAWVDTDDLNDGFNRKGKKIKDDLHYSVEGYKKLGQRFADKAISLIEGK